jgi:hypothetical protein
MTTEEKEEEMARQPVSVALPGNMTRGIDELDTLCKDLRTARDMVNDGTATIKALKPTAMTLLGKHKRSSYTKHGLRLTLVSGHDDVLIKAVKGETATKAAVKKNAPARPRRTKKGTTR